MVVTLELRATQHGVIWPRRPLVSSKGLLSCLQNVPHSSYDRRATTFRAVAFNAAGDGFAATDEKGRVFVFFVTSNKYALVQHLGAPTVACCFSPTRKSELLVTSENEMVRCIDVQSQSLISSLRGHRFPARSASFQKSGNLALTASQDAVILWDTKDWSRYRVLNAGPGVEEATFVAKGDLVAVCFQDDSIMMWELDSLALRYRFSLPPQEQPAGITKIAVSEDYKVLVATGRVRFIYVWDFEAQTIIRIIELPVPIEHVLTFSFVPGQVSTICLLGSEGNLYFLNVAAKKPKIKMEISNPGRKITSFDIENHGRYLAACTDDGCLLLYDLDIATETARRTHLSRKQQGLNEHDRNMLLHTRSVIAQDVAVTARESPTAQFEEDYDGERPASSKLIDGIFGLRAKRDKENVVAEPRIEFQEKRSARASPRKLLSPHKPVVPTPSKLTHLPPAHSANGGQPKKKSVLQMTSLSKAEIELNRKRLQASLDCNGKYPAKYRLLVWRFLLRLPKNDDAFKALAAKGPHPSYLRLHEQYPLRNQRQLRRLHRVLSAIAYWCPAFGEVPYLPAIVYPFVKIYRENDVAAFEASLSVFLHWCGDYLVSLPYPPIFVLSSIETQLEKIDSQLHDHFIKLDVSSEVYAWSLLKTIFTEVLSEDEWMCLWDHLISASDKPRYLYVAVIAYLSYFRTALLAARDRYSIEQFLHQQNAIQIHAYIQLLKNLGGKLGDLQQSSVEDHEDSAPSYWPLPTGQYPAFANYPKFIVDFQITERNRIALEEAEMIQKKKLLERVESECDKLKAEHQRWLQQKQALIAAEEQRRKEMLKAEKSRVLNLKTLDHETRKRRLERLAELEKSAHETLEQTSTLFQAEYLRLESELEMLRERSGFELSSRQQEEELQRVEFETEKRVREIHKQREIEERLHQLRTEFVTRIKQDELQDILLFERWKRDDESQRLKAKRELEKREKEALLQQERTIRQQLENQLLDHTLEKERQLRELQTQRDARVQEEHVNHEIAEDFAAQERRVAGKLRLDRDRQRSRVVRRPRNDSSGDEMDPVNRSSHRTERFGVGQSLRDDAHGEEKVVVDSTMRTQRNTLLQETALRENKSNAGNGRGRQSPDHSVSVHSAHRPPAVKDRDVDFDETGHVTSESIRLIDTARRRLSSVLHQSNESESSSSSASSFTSPPVVRTTQELSLLEKALADISSSSGSSSDEQSQSGRQNTTSHRELFDGISPIHTMRQDTSITLANGTTLLQEEDQINRDSSLEVSRSEANAATRHVHPTFTPMARGGLNASLPSLSSGDESEEASSMLQRPIEELEKELGIRFDALSEEEKEGDSDDEDEEELEDDRALLLHRAKKLLAEQNFASDDEDDDHRSQ